MEWLGILSLYTINIWDLFKGFMWFWVLYAESDNLCYEISTFYVVGSQKREWEMSPVQNIWTWNANINTKMSAHG